MLAERPAFLLIVSLLSVTLVLVPGLIEASDVEGIPIPTGIMTIDHPETAWEQPDEYTRYSVLGSLYEYYGARWRLPTAAEMGVLLSHEPVENIVSGRPVRVWNGHDALGSPMLPMRAGDVAYSLSPCGHIGMITFYNDDGFPSLTEEVNY